MEADTIILSRAEYEALIERLEDAEDALAIRGFRESLEAKG